MRILQPPGWVKPRGFSNGIVTSGRIVFVGGQVGWNANGKFETADFVAQARQALYRAGNSARRSRQPRRRSSARRCRYRPRS